MLNQSEDWSDIIERYKLSGLSQRAFCNQHKVSWNQFHYRWTCYKAKSGLAALENKEKPAFEAITIRSTFVEETDVTKSRSLVIHFSNQIRCEVAIDLESQEFSSLLKQLVAVC